MCSSDLIGHGHLRLPIMLFLRYHTDKITKHLHVFLCISWLAGQPFCSLITVFTLIEGSRAFAHSAKIRDLRALAGLREGVHRAATVVR